MLQRIRNIITITLIALALAPFCTFARAAEDRTSDLPPVTSLDDVVARVNDFEITEGMLRNQVNSIMPYVSFHNSVSDKRYRAIRKKALEDIITNRIIYMRALKEKKARVSEKEYREKLDALRKRIPKGQTLDDVLKRSNLTMEDLREEIRYMAVVARIKKARIEELKKKAEAIVTDAYMKDYYRKNIKKFIEPEKVHLRLILLRVDPGMGVRAWNSARKRALKILKEARSGADFAELAKKYSEGPNKENGGDMGWSHRGSLLEEVDYAVSRMKVGEISEPIMTIYGYNIVKIEGIKPKKLKKYSRLNHKKLRNELRQKEFKRLWDEWLEDLRKDVKVEYLRDL